jgi:hypothetical protein
VQTRKATLQALAQAAVRKRLREVGLESALRARDGLSASLMSECEFAGADDKGRGDVRGAGWLEHVGLRAPVKTGKVL